MGCTDSPYIPMTYGEQMVYGEHTDVQGVCRGIWMYGGIQMYRGCTEVWGHMDVQGYIFDPYADNPHMHASNVGKTSLFKAEFLHLKSCKNKESSDHTGNEVTSDIPTGGSGQDIKNKMTNTCHL